jgi:hypothetical protein
MDIEHLGSVNDLNQQILKLVESDEFKKYREYTYSNYPTHNIYDEVYNQLVKNTRIAVWNAVLESIKQLQEALRTRLGSTSEAATKKFIQTLIDGIQILDGDVKKIDKYITDNFGRFITYGQIKTGRNVAKVMSWYIEYKLKEMGIIVISKPSNDVAQGYETFTKLLRQGYKLYIVHPSKTHEYADKSVDTRQRHNDSITVRLRRRRSPEDTYYVSSRVDSTDTKDPSELYTSDYVVTEYDPKNSEDTLDGYMLFVKDVYEKVFNIGFKTEDSRIKSDTKIGTGGALFIYGQVVTSLTFASEVLWLFANELLEGVNPTITLLYPGDLLVKAKKDIIKLNANIFNRDGAKKLFERNTVGGKKRSSKKTYRARIKSNNRNKYRSRCSRTKYHKKTARKA